MKKERPPFGPGWPEAVIQFIRIRLAYSANFIAMLSIGISSREMMIN